MKTASMPEPHAVGPMLFEAACGNDRAGALGPSNDSMVVIDPAGGTLTATVNTLKHLHPTPPRTCGCHTQSWGRGGGLNPRDVV